MNANGNQVIKYTMQLNGLSTLCNQWINDQIIHFSKINKFCYVIWNKNGVTQLICKKCSIHHWTTRIASILS